ncbi:MAG: hypothetical protein K8H88_23845 [Sandaracinaceae bacterium]|nr:hypothetical protein [Sandaracinaceae bacterium]
MRMTWAVAVGLLLLTAGCGKRALTQTECDAMTEWMRGCLSQAEPGGPTEVIERDVQGATRFCRENVGLEIDEQKWEFAENERSIGCSATGTALQQMRESARR